MNNLPALKPFGLAFALSILASTAMAETQDDNFFLPSVSPAEKITVAFKGKPPYRNRHQVWAQRRAQKAASGETENLEKTELFALETGGNNEESPVIKKSVRKRYGHPYHR